MVKYVIDGDTLKGLADALRSVTGETRSYTPTEMIEAVTTIMETGTYILVDESGNELPAVFLENERVFTATANDIREGTTAVTESGVTEGTKEIPAYHTSEGYKIIPAESPFILDLTNGRHDYTKLQAIFCPFNKNIANSVAADKVAIEDYVYPVNSTIAAASITVETNNKRINFGITNNSNSPYLIRYFSYKEEY